MKVLEGANIFGGSYIWIEYEDIDRLREFIENLDLQKSKIIQVKNNLKMAILKI